MLKIVKLNLLSKNEIRYNSNEVKTSKHFPPSVREWNNSIYVYNKNNLNLIPNATISAIKIIKGYFSLYNQKIERKIRTERLMLRYRRLSSNKIYISNGEFKHTNNKIIINLYLFNRQKHNYMLALKKLYLKTILNIKKKNKFKLKLKKNNNLNKLTIKKAKSKYRIKINKFNNFKLRNINLYKLINNKLNNQKNVKSNKSRSKNLRLKKITKIIEFITPQIIKFNNFKPYIHNNPEFKNYKSLKFNMLKILKFNNYKPLNFKTANFFKFNKYKPYIYDKLKILKFNNYKLSKYNKPKITELKNYKFLNFSKLKSIKFDKYKSKCIKHNTLIKRKSKSTKFNKFLIKRINLISKRINFISKRRNNLLKLINKEKFLAIKAFKKSKNKNQKKYFFISAYITEFYKKFVKKSLRKLQLYFYYRQLLYINKSKYNYSYLQYLSKFLYSLYNKNIEYNLINLKRFYLHSDILSESITLKLTRNRKRLLRKLNSIKKKVKIKKSKNFSGKKFLNKKLDYKKNSTILPNSLKKNIINNLKYKGIAGFRLEAKGRLTRRYTASRSVLKIKYKGNLLDLSSSQKGISTVLLKGNLKSNLQYTKLKSRSRIGSFGIKG